MLSRVLNSLTGVLSCLGMIGILAMMLHIASDVIARNIFGVSVPATLELVTRYYMLMMALLPLAWVEQKRLMIVVEVFSGLLGNIATRMLDVLVAAICFAVYALLAISTWEKAAEQFDVGAYVIALDTQIIVWPGYFALPIGFALAALVCFFRILRLLFSGSATHAG